MSTTMKIMAIHRVAKSIRKQADVNADYIVFEDGVPTVELARRDNSLWSRTFGAGRDTSYGVLLRYKREGRFVSMPSWSSIRLALEFRSCW